MKKLVLLLYFFPCLLFSQSINHWETAVFDNDIWKYLEGTSEPDTNWRTLNFNDASWLQGQGGVGYGDGDDSTVISSVTSLYLRKTFNIVDTADIITAVLNVDYDDAFVAYLNNVEIARANIGTVGDHPLYNQGSSSLHEAQMYQGGSPDQFIINTQVLKDNILPGSNILSVQVHNDNISSSDLTGRIFLSFGIANTTTNYSPTPSWFIPPFTTSNLPIVVINTNGQTIVDDPRIVCDMGIIDNGFGVMNSISDPFNDYNGKISIEYRGSSSQSFPKKPYALETQDSIGNNNNVSLLGMPVENDWILYAPYSDKSLMRNFLTFDLGRKMGSYSPRTVYCELVIDGDYKGIYVLMEKIKRDNDRVDIAKLDSNDVAGDSLTGGYIIKVDKYTGIGGLDWLSDFPNIGGGDLHIQYHYPQATALQPQQMDYIEHFMDSFEYALAGPNFTDSLIGYSKYIDVNSFIDLYIINELSKNIDGYRLSTYMYKDRDDNGGKLIMGPFWDYNLAFGNADYCDGGITSGWEVNTGCGDNNPFWFERLLDDTTYQNKLKCRWEYLRERSFHQDSIFNFIDSMAFYLDDAQQRNFQKWDILGNYVWPNYYVGNTYQDELQFFRTWIGGRLMWIDSNILGNCYVVLGCTDPVACNYDISANTNDGSCNYSSSSYDTLVSNISISWNGMILTTSGDYSITLYNSVGCDSIVNLNFTFNTVSVINYNNTRQRTLIKITDILGRETHGTRNEFLFYIFNDGTVEKRIVIIE
ncbi:MAG: CotH kinase family protein [Flavobacteriales bacterium]|nr:CotH kinase family protein [Flavobacteriales bacterium]